MIAKAHLTVLLTVPALFAPPWVHGANPLWTFTTPDAILASPAIARDGTVYLASYDRLVYAITPAGNLKWTASLPEPAYIYSGTYTAVYGTPSIGRDGTLYVPAENGILLALDPATGASHWSYNTAVNPRDPQGLYSSTAVGPDGTVYFGSYDQYLYAINPNGTLKWRALFDAGIFASPVVGPRTIYSGADDGKVYAINSIDGTRKWTLVTGSSAINASPSLDTNGNLYIGVASTQNPRFFSINPHGTTNWIFTAGGGVRSSAAIGSDGTIYFGCDDGQLYALNPNGTLKWNFNAGSPVRSSPALAADGTIYCGCQNGTLQALDANGSSLWSFQTSGEVSASPAIGPDGSVYFASGNGSLYVFRGRRPPMISAWPMFRQDPARGGCGVGQLTNHPPVLAAIPDQTIAAGMTLVLTNLASDPDQDQLTFRLAPGAPAGVSLNPTNGLLSWTPAPIDLSCTSLIGVAVVDSGWPQLSDVQYCNITVGGPRIQRITTLNRTVTISWSAFPGRTYRIQYKTTLADPAWTDLPGDVLAGTNPARKTDIVDSTTLQRFYRVALLP